MACMAWARSTAGAPAAGTAGAPSDPVMLDWERVVTAVKRGRREESGTPKCVR